MSLQPSVLSDLQIKLKITKTRFRRSISLAMPNFKTLEIKTNLAVSDAYINQVIATKINWIKNAQQKLQFRANQLQALHRTWNQEQLKKIRSAAKPYLIKELHKYSQESGLNFTSLRISSGKRVWGSCNSKNGINLNWKICLLPLQLQKYIILHELAHTEIKNHSANFWKLVNQICPDYKESEKKLKTHSYLLELNVQ